MSPDFGGDYSSPACLDFHAPHRDFFRPNEEFSIKARTWLTHQAVDMVRQHPILGGGVGSFVIELAERAPVGYLVEPAHNLPLLVTSDLGLGGALILVGLGVGVIRGIRQAHRPETIILGATVLGLCTASLFDHSLWTLAPGRMLFVLMLGLWAGQEKPGEF